MSNTLTNYIPQMLAMGMVALRENSVMARLVNRAYDPNPGTKGSTVDVPIPSAVAAADVVPATTAQAVTDVVPTTVPIALTQWKQAGFVLSDQARTQIADGAIPMQLTEAMRSLANVVDQYVLSLYTGIYAFGGTGGTTPFASTRAEYVAARKELARNLAPYAPRYCVIDEDAEGNALNQEAFTSSAWTGTKETYVSGFIKNVLGADWHMDQNIPTHTAGTLVNGAGTRVGLITTAVSAAASTMAIDHTTLTGTILKGDVFTVAGATGTYVVTNASPVTCSGNAATGITFSPAVKTGETFANNAAVTFQPTHVVNLLFHRDAIALATRPLEDGGLGHTMSAVDPISGLALRLEMSRQHSQDQIKYDILYGAALVRPQLAARILG